MLVVFITKIKRKLLKTLRFAFVLAIVATIIMQLWGFIKSSGLSNKDDVPSGNPMRVEAPVAEIGEDGGEPGWFDKLFTKLRNYCGSINK